MIVGLSCLSSQGLWILCDPRAELILAASAWSNTDSTGLSVGMGLHFDLLLKAAGVESQQITALFGTTGPGAFTGLRMSSAFLQGLAQGLAREALPVRSIPTYDLAGQTVFIPLRHQKAKDLTLAEALAAGLEFLKIESSHGYEIALPQPGDLVWGLKDHPTWPAPENLRLGIKKNLDSALGLTVHYGLEPKISGRRG